MSWSGILNNQAVTLNNLKDAVNNGVFTLKNSIPSGTDCITKSDANYYVNINTSNPGYASKSPNQLVYKNDLTAPNVGVVYTPSSGSYPLIGDTYISTSGVINNYYNEEKLLWCVFNSASLSSGVVYDDYMTIVPLSSKVIYGENFFYPEYLIYSEPYSLSPNSSYNIGLVKGDYLGGGSVLRFYHSNIYGGDMTPI